MKSSLANYIFYLFLIISFSRLLLAEGNANHSPTVVAVVGNSKLREPYSFTEDKETQKILQQVALEDEGRNLLKRGLFEAAMEKFKLADHPDLKVSGYQDTVAKALIREIHCIRGDYEKALGILDPLVKINPYHDPWLDEKLELEAFIKARSVHSHKTIYEHIQYLKEKYNKELPPKKYWFGSLGITTDIIRLYDHIGDLDGGIAFVDQILVYKKLRPKARSEYLKVRESFEQDKKEGFKGCLDAKVGTVCMGRATQALIQSDYFPW